MKKYIMIVLFALFSMNAYAYGWLVSGGIDGRMSYNQVPNENTIRMSLTTTYPYFGKVIDLVGRGAEGGFANGTFSLMGCEGQWEASQKLSEGGSFLYSLIFESIFTFRVTIKTQDNAPIVSCWGSTDGLLLFQPLLMWDVSGEVTSFQYVPNK